MLVGWPLPQFKGVDRPNGTSQSLLRMGWVWTEKSDLNKLLPDVMSKSMVILRDIPWIYIYIYHRYIYIFTYHRYIYISNGENH